MWLEPSLANFLVPSCVKWRPGLTYGSSLEKNEAYVIPPGWKEESSEETTGIRLKLWLFFLSVSVRIPSFTSLSSVFLEPFFRSAFIINQITQSGKWTILSKCTYPYTHTFSICTRVYLNTWCINWCCCARYQRWALKVQTLYMYYVFMIQIFRFNFLNWILRLVFEPTDERN